MRKIPETHMRGCDGDNPCCPKCWAETVAGVAARRKAAWEERKNELRKVEAK
jgi:hypothetical protein